MSASSKLLVPFACAIGVAYAPAQSAQPTAYMSVESLSISQLPIPSNGFTADQFATAQLKIRSDPNDSHLISINKVIVQVFERDVASDDLIQTFTFTSNLPALTPTQQELSLEFRLQIRAEDLNRQCAFGCETWAGRLAENGYLEPYIRASFEYAVSPYSSHTSPVPEPESSHAAFAGLFTLICTVALRSKSA